MKILTVISNFNEEEAIQQTIDDFNKNAAIDSDLLVIDNCSSDNSLQILEKANVNYLRHPVNTGGSAGVIKTALQYACEYNYDIYCHMDGDFQHRAEDLGRLIEPIVSDHIDLVIGSRFIDKQGFQSLPARRVGIQIFSYLVSRFTNTSITDLTSGFRAYNRRSIEYFSRQWRHEIDPCTQMIMLASFAGLNIREVPVVMRSRETGVSEFNFYRSTAFPIKALISLVGTLLQRHSVRRA